MRKFWWFHSQVDSEESIFVFELEGDDCFYLRGSYPTMGEVVADLAFSGISNLTLTRMDAHSLHTFLAERKGDITNALTAA